MAQLSTLARFAVMVIGLGFALFLVGIFPELLSLDFTTGFGRLQIFAFLIGLLVMTFGAYLYMYATRHRALAPRLREDVGTRLMATGLVLAWVSGLADLLGIGSNFGAETPVVGSFQALGVAFGIVVIVAGIGLYAQRQFMNE